MLFLHIVLILVAYILIKGVCIIINENEDIKLTIPKLLERASLGGTAFLSQLIFF